VAGGPGSDGVSSTFNVDDALPVFGRPPPLARLRISKADREKERRYGNDRAQRSIYCYTE
jgi:hypothetical protein